MQESHEGALLLASMANEAIVSLSAEHYRVMSCMTEISYHEGIRLHERNVTFGLQYVEYVPPSTWQEIGGSSLQPVVRTRDSLGSQHFASPYTHCSDNLPAFICAKYWDIQGMSGSVYQLCSFEIQSRNIYLE